MKNKGITLIALVITIIILLILAGITISQLTGSGLFENAKLAKEKYENAQQKEDDILKQYENTIKIESDRDTITIPTADYTRLLNASNALNYSTDEKVVGTWTNGKKLYQKTIITTVPAQNSTISTNVQNGENAFIVSGYISSASGNNIQTQINSISCKADGSSIGNPTDDYIGRPLVVTIQYTKTTDPLPTTN